jgi:hypothetical protein
MFRSSPQFPNWEPVYRDVFARFADAWSTGSLTTEEVARELADQLSAPISSVLSHIQALCRDVQLYRLPAQLLRSCHLPQALVTVNPDGFSRYVLPPLGLEAHLEAIVTSWEEGTLDKPQLCEVAVARLGLPRAGALLIDNVEQNVEQWVARGGRGYWFRGEAEMLSALGLELRELADACGL